MFEFFHSIQFEKKYNKYIKKKRFQMNIYRDFLKKTMAKYI